MVKVGALWLISPVTNTVRLVKRYKRTHHKNVLYDITYGPIKDNFKTPQKCRKFAEAPVVPIQKQEASCTGHKAFCIAGRV